MGKAESSEVSKMLLDGSKLGATFWKNVRGNFFTHDGRRVAAGLSAKGSSDLIGFVLVEVTPEMVGQRIPVFGSWEAKAKTSAKPEQVVFCDGVARLGGFSGFGNHQKFLSELEKYLLRSRTE